MKILIIILVLISASQATAESYKPLEHLWEGTRDIPNKQNYIVFGVGSALTLFALFNLDGAVHDTFANQNRLGWYDDIGNKFLGTGIPGALIGLSTLTYGLVADKDRHVQAGESHLEALVANFAYTEVIKDSVRRNRPDSSTATSFPSGHTSTAFASATNLLDHYGWATGGPALALATFTGLCRLSGNAHYLSDVLFGATLGAVVGHGYAIHHLTKNETSSAFLVMPYFDTRNEFGIRAAMEL
jgi:membrane-associated phospholipid phosphatase